jgi:hypothetical protein
LTTLLLPEDETQTFPDGSIARPEAKLNPPPV